MEMLLTKIKHTTCRAWICKKIYRIKHYKKHKICVQKWKSYNKIQEPWLNKLSTEWYCTLEQNLSGNEKQVVMYMYIDWPLCMHLGISCVQRLLGLGPPPGPDNNSGQRRRAHSDISPTRLLHLSDPAGHLCLCVTCVGGKRAN